VYLMSAPDDIAESRNRVSPARGEFDVLPGADR